jgi:hypothetical protein
MNLVWDNFSVQKRIHLENYNEYKMAVKGLGKVDQQYDGMCQEKMIVVFSRWQLLNEGCILGTLMDFDAADKTRKSY